MKKLIIGLVIFIVALLIAWFLYKKHLINKIVTSGMNGGLTRTELSRMSIGSLKRVISGAGQVGIVQTGN